MAIAFDAVNTGGVGGSGNSFSFSHTASGTDRIVMVWVAVYDAASNTLNGSQNLSVTYGGEYMCGAGGGWTGGGIDGGAGGQMFYMLNPPTGSQTVSATSNQLTLGGYKAASVSYTGVRGIGSQSIAMLASNGTALAADPVESETGSLVVTGWGSRNNTSTTYSSSSGTLRFNSAGSGGGGNAGLAGFQEDTGGATSTSPTVTGTNSHWAASAVALLPTTSTSVGIAFTPALNIGAMYVTGSSTTLGGTFSANIRRSDAQTCLVVAVTMSLTTSAGTVTCSVTYNGVAMTQYDLQQGAAASGNEAIGMYYMFNPPTGVQTVSVSTGGTTTKTVVGAAAVAYNNVNCLGPATVNDTNTGTTPSLTVAPSTNRERIMAVYTSNNSTYSDPNNVSFHVAIGATATGTGDIIYVIDGKGSASETLAFSLTSSVRWRGMAIALKPEIGQFFDHFW